MPSVTIRRRVLAPAERVWSLVTDVRAHERWVPLTSMKHDDGPPRPGWVFTGVTGVGPLSFADRMVVEVADPPRPGHTGVFSVRKVGRLLGGWAHIEVAPSTDDPGSAGETSELTWAEEIVLRPEAVGRRLAGIVDPVTRFAFSRVVDRLAAEAEGRSR